MTGPDKVACLSLLGLFCTLLDALSFDGNEAQYNMVANGAKSQEVTLKHTYEVQASSIVALSNSPCSFRSSWHDATNWIIEQSA